MLKGKLEMQDARHTKVGANLSVKMYHPRKGVQFMTLQQDQQVKEQEDWPNRLLGLRMLDDNSVRQLK